MTALTKLEIHSEEELLAATMRYIALPEFTQRVSHLDNFEHMELDIEVEVVHNPIKTWPVLATYVNKVGDSSIPLCSYVWFLVELKPEG